MNTFILLGLVVLLVLFLLRARRARSAGGGAPEASRPSRRRSRRGAGAEPTPPAAAPPPRPADPSPFPPAPRATATTPAAPPDWTPHEMIVEPGWPLPGEISGSWSAGPETSASPVVTLETPIVAAPPPADEVAASLAPVVDATPAASSTDGDSWQMPAVAPIGAEPRPEPPADGDGAATPPLWVPGAVDEEPAWSATDPVEDLPIWQPEAAPAPPAADVWAVDDAVIAPAEAGPAPPEDARPAPAPESPEDPPSPADDADPPIWRPAVHDPAAVIEALAATSLADVADGLPEAPPFVAAEPWPADPPDPIAAAFDLRPEPPPVTEPEPEPPTWTPTPDTASIAAVDAVVTARDDIGVQSAEVAELVPSVLDALRPLVRVSDHVGVTPRMLVVMRALAERPLSVGEQAARLGVSRPVVADIAARLEQMGLTRRERDERDRRRVRVALTDRGRRVHQESVDAPPADAVALALGRMDDAERDGLLHGLRALARSAAAV